MQKSLITSQSSLVLRPPGGVPGRVTGAVAAGELNTGPALVLPPLLELVES
jgi:hypothetical protein